MRCYELTEDQATTQVRLSRGIDRALGKGQHIPCLEEPETWDSEATPVKVCAGCPVLDLCSEYALTGAVSEGIIAGMRASQIRGPRVAGALARAA